MRTIARTFFTLTAGAALFTFTAFTKSEAPEWKFDGVHSSFTFMVNHLGTPFFGFFKEIDGTLKFDPQNTEGSSVNFTIKSASVATQNEQRDKHLQSADFFDAEKYPAITFQSEKVVKKGDKDFVATGKLTVKDVTKTIDLPFTLTTYGDNPFSKEKMLMGMKMTTVIKRSDYHLGADGPIGDDVVVQFFAEFGRTK